MFNLSILVYVLLQFPSADPYKNTIWDTILLFPQKHYFIAIETSFNIFIKYIH